MRIKKEAELVLKKHQDKINAIKRNSLAMNIQREWRGGKKREDVTNKLKIIELKNTI